MSIDPTSREGDHLGPAEAVAEAGSQADASRADAYATRAPDAKAAAPGAWQLSGSRYQVVGVIGRGGMGVVLQAVDTDIGRPLAIKLMLAQGDAQASERFLAEARITGQLQHPGIPPVHEIGRLDDGRPFFAMKLITGRTLDELLRERAGPQADLPRFLKVFEQIAQTLAYAHDQGVIHRDLKPSNVMVGAFGEVQVMDWGLARRLRGNPPEGAAAGTNAPMDADRAAGQAVLPTPGDLIETAEIPGPYEETVAVTPPVERPTAGGPADSDSGRLTQAGTVLGTPAFMPPEQARGQIEALDERCDVFGLGAILCVILTGEPPYRGDRLTSLQRAPAGRSVGRARAAGRLWGGREARGPLPAMPGGRSRRPLAPRRRGGRLRDRLSGVRAGAVGAGPRPTGRGRSAGDRGTQALVGDDGLVADHGRRHLAGHRRLAVVEGGPRQPAGRSRRAFVVSRARGDERLDDAQRQRQELHDGLRDERRAAQLMSDLEVWRGLLASAQAAWKRADALAAGDQESLAPELRQRLTDLNAGLAADERDRQLAFELDKIRFETSTPVDGSIQLWRAAPKLDRAFHDAGYRIPTGDSVQTASRLWESPIRLPLVAAIDFWALVTRDGQLRETLLRVARLADPDPWRDRLRQAEAWRDPDHLRQLAAEVDLAQQSPQLLAAFAQRLGSAKGDVPGLLRRALVEHPRDFWLYFELGHAGRDPSEQAGDFRAALAVRPESVYAYYGLGVVHYNERKLDEAEACYRRAIALGPRYAQAYANLGLLLSDRGRLDEAIAHYRKAIDLDPELASTHTNLGAALKEQGLLDEAEVHCRRALEIDPDYVPGHINLGVVLRTMGKLDEAVASFRSAIRLAGENPWAWCNLGHVLTQQEKFDEGLTARRARACAGIAPARLVSSVGRVGAGGEASYCPGQETAGSAPRRGRAGRRARSTGPGDAVPHAQAAVWRRGTVLRRGVCRRSEAGRRPDDWPSLQRGLRSGAGHRPDHGFRKGHRRSARRLAPTGAGVAASGAECLDGRARSTDHPSDDSVPHLAALADRPRPGQRARRSGAGEGPGR